MNIKNNSKNIKKNDIFVCTHDDSIDKHKYINSNLINKKCTLIVDKNIYLEGIPTIKVNNTNDTYFQMLNDYYGHPLDDIKLIGVTGTDGKTSVSMIIYQLLNNFYKTAYIGTNGFRYDDKIINFNNTTPDLSLLFKFFKICHDKNIKYIVMEASSEGLLHNRCYNLLFDRSILTNITKDHMNVHKYINNYVDAKSKLFLQTNGYSILNKDDKYFKNIKKKCLNIITYGMNKYSDYYFYNIESFSSHTKFKLKVKNKIYIIKSPYLGIFNVYNLVSAIALINSLNININDIISKIDTLKDIDGRINQFKFKNFNVVIDYAHTINATKEILKLFTSVKKGRIVTVVGAAGGRDSTKRRYIGQLVCKYSDYVYFTMDDPRYEDSFFIFKDMIKDVNSNNYEYIKNRKNAIKKALNNALENDTILILGKGIDNYMAIKNKYKKYSDYNIIYKYYKKNK